jgi:prevent-host-death family protein
MHEAKSQLSRLVEAVESGAEKEIVIARNGKPAVKIVPFVQRKRRLGLAQGKYADFSLEEFNASDKEIERLFYEGSLWPDESDDAPSR